MAQGFALGDSPTESPVTPATLNPTGVVTIPGTIPEKGSKDKASNPWWDAVHGITPEKLDHLITAINEMNELFGIQNFPYINTQRFRKFNKSRQKKLVKSNKSNFFS